MLWTRTTTKWQLVFLFFWSSTSLKFSGRKVSIEIPFGSYFIYVAALSMQGLVGNFAGLWLISEHGNVRTPNHIISPSPVSYSCFSSSFVAGRSQSFIACAVASTFPSTSVNFHEFM